MPDLRRLPPQWFCKRAKFRRILRAAVQAIARDFSIRCAGKARKLTSTSGLFRRQSAQNSKRTVPDLSTKAESNAQAESLVRLMNTTDTLITAPRVLSAAAVFLRVEGPQSRNITVDGGDFSKTEKPLAFADGADEGAVKLRS